MEKKEKMILTEKGCEASVEILENGGGFKCKFCGQQFADTTSATRFKWHWSGVEGRGVQVCAQVPTHIQEAAFLALQQPPNKKRKVVMMPSSSNMIGATSTSSREQINQVGNLVGGLERIQLEQDAHMPGSGIARQATDLVTQIDIERTHWREIIASIAQSMEVDVEDGAAGLVQPVSGASSSRGLPFNTTHETRGDALPTSSTKLVGRAFEEHKNAIWSWLMKDEASFIGIYGMGGVGKTALVKLIYNQLRKRPDAFRFVHLISVSHDFSIYRLQKRIARHLGFDLTNEDDESKRAQKLLDALVVQQQSILILDDVWNSFDPETVGIPVQWNGCKLILTTRSLRVCREMGCLHKIKVEPLSPGEDWILFMENLIHDVVLSPEVEQVAKSVTRECDGLPLAIIVIARSMRGVDDMREWRNTLKKLKEYRVMDMEQKVFRLLRFSYDRLDDFALQKCFLYCALFPEDYEIDRSDLIGYLIDDGVIHMMKHRQEEFDEGHAILNKLENVCLLERYCDGSAVKMHDLLRDMALQIQQENYEAMVKAGECLEEMPNVEEWNVNLVRVSLMQNGINKIPRSHSPNCPNLSTLLLRDNDELRFIADSFFKQFYRLKVLDLSRTGITILPNYVSELATLNALLLRKCEKLKQVPSLKKLGALRRLDLEDTTLENVPEGLKRLSNLRFLRLSGCGREEFPTGILRKLSHLQVFILDSFYPPVTVEGKEVARLKKLETLRCYFGQLSDLAEYLKSRDGIQSPSSYDLFVGFWGVIEHKIMKKRGCTSKTVGLSDLSISGDGGFQVMFPNDMKELIIYQCDDATSLCDVSSSITYAAKLEIITIRGCSGMESLLSSSWFCSAPLHQALLSQSIFSCLKKLDCDCCESMERLFPFVLLPNLKSLEVIRVGHCENLKEIIATRDEESSCSSATEFILPKLKILELRNLPKLRSICCAKLMCDSLEEICIRQCPRLKRLPVSLHMLDNGQPSPQPSLKKIIIDRETWDSVEWSHPNAKDVLLPLVRF